MDSHIQFILSQCAQRMCLFKLLRHQGLPDAQLSVIANAVIISRLLYALPAWAGFLSVELVNRINAFLRRLQRFGYLQCRMTVAELTNSHDLFCKLCAPTHALNHLLPPARNRVSLRTLGHSYQLPEYSTDLHKKSFLMRCLYSFVKWNSFWFAALYCMSFWFCFLCLLFELHWVSLVLRPTRHKTGHFGDVYYLMCVCRT